MNEQKEFLISSFFGFPLSILILGGLFFVALLNRSLGLASVAGTTLLLMVGLSLWTRLAPLRTYSYVHVGRTRLFPGENVHLEVSIRNVKLLPFYLSIEGPFGMKGQAIVPPVSQLNHSWNIPITWNIPINRRGVYSLEACSLTFGDPFGLSCTKRTLPLPEGIIVYPRLKRMEGFKDRFQEFFGLHPAKGLVEDPAWYAGTPVPGNTRDRVQLASSTGK